MLMRFDVTDEKNAALVPWNGEPLPTWIKTAVLTFEDGRTHEVEVERYVVVRKLPPNVETMWTREALLEYGLLRVVPAVAPAGKHFVGEPRYEREGDIVREVRDLEDDPPLPETVTISKEEHDSLVADAENWRIKGGTLNVIPRDAELVADVEAKP